jgi:hypothetical protein
MVEHILEKELYDGSEKRFELAVLLKLLKILSMAKGHFG